MGTCDVGWGVAAADGCAEEDRERYGALQSLREGDQDKGPSQSASQSLAPCQLRAEFIREAERHRRCLLLFSQALHPRPPPAVRTEKVCAKETESKVPPLTLSTPP